MGIGSDILDTCPLKLGRCQILYSFVVCQVYSCPYFAVMKRVNESARVAHHNPTFLGLVS
jgi:hypothetical protein